MKYAEYAALVMAHSGMTIADGTKRCCMCDEVRPLNEFYVNRRNGRRWLAARCNQCHNAGARPTEPKIYRNWFHTGRRWA